MCGVGHICWGISHLTILIESCRQHIHDSFHNKTEGWTESWQQITRLLLHAGVCYESLLN